MESKLHKKLIFIAAVEGYFNKSDLLRRCDLINIQDMAIMDVNILLTTVKIHAKVAASAYEILMAQVKKITPQLGITAKYGENID